MWKYNNLDELYHYGILGMRWGVRRYQKEDGSLTDAGKKKYSTMDPNKLNKKLKKEVHKERRQNGKYTGMSNQWIWNNTIGANSKEATKKFNNEMNKINNIRDKKIMEIDKEYRNKKISYDKGQKQVEKVYDDHMKNMINIGAAKIAGKKYSKNAIQNIGKVNIGYLQDLGYNKETSEYIQELLSKSNRVKIY